MSVAMKFDVQSTLELRWATTDKAIIQQGVSFLAFEEQLPAEKQLKDLSPLFFTGLITAAQDAAAGAGAGEADRARAAEVVRQADEQLRPLLDKVILRLKNRHADNLAELEQWGLKTKIGTRGVTVNQPKNVTDWRAFLLAYVAKESSQPAATQISDPPLSRLAAIAAALQENQAVRTKQTHQRLRGVAARATAVQTLLDALQAAAAVLIVTRFGGQITRDLQQWGYELVAKTAPPQEEPATPEEPANP
jgi:hypothetical protein